MINTQTERVVSLLPPWLAGEVRSCGNLEEIRIRRCRPPELVFSGGRHRILTRQVSADEMLHLCESLCMGSLHSQEENIQNGFISYPDNWRIGVCGRYSKGNIGSLGDISSINIRIPSRIRGCSKRIVEYMEKTSFSVGILVFAPPGAGKTTILSDVALTLTTSPYLRRVALIDSRAELAPDDWERQCVTLDVYTNMSKENGIERAARTMAPQVIICDEISATEARALLEVHSTGVPFVASAHASSLRELFSSPGIAALDGAGVFGAYAFLGRTSTGRTVAIFDRADARRQASLSG